MENFRNWPNPKIAFVTKVAVVLIFIFVLPAVVLAKDKSSQINSYLNTATIFEKSFQYEKAIGVIKSCEYQNNSNILKYLAKLFCLTGKSKEAYQKLNSLTNKSWVDYLYLGLINEKLGQVNQAIDAYKKSLKLEKNSIGLFRLAKIYRARKKYNKAANFFKKLIDYDSSIRVAYYYLGQCLRKVDQNREAYESLAKAFSFFPGRIKVKEELKEVKRKLGKDFFEKRKKLKAEKRQKVKLVSYQKQENVPYVRIGVAVDLGKFSLLSPSDFKIKSKDLVYEGKPDIFYQFQLKENKIVLSNHKTGQVYETFFLPVEIISRPINRKSYPFYILDVVYGSGNFWHKKIDRAYRGSFEVILKNNKINLVNIVSIEEYLYGVLAAEIPAGANKEALKAQAVLARSLAIRNKARHIGQGFDFCADSHCQVYHGLSAETESTKEAVDETRGRIISYEGKVPEIFYHSNCGGCLSPDIFGQKQYLAKGRDSENKNMPQSIYKKQQWFLEYPKTFCFRKSSKFRWQRIYDQEDFSIAFGARIKDLTNIIPREQKDCCRYAKMDVVIGDELISLESGLEIRNFFDHLRSSAFSLELRKSAGAETEMLIFWGSGFGHGTGLCQEGAIGMAKEGYNYKQILNHYYPEGKIEKYY
ncbi:MAG: SpoIID/LytB domain-containing protein [Candidatus Omnitrophica bacterium]|nr:SpoIID/LytB domain-containing protein [Candidatus Omnitrophota bacterium]MCF7893473.1 SpoIID/LytB domain-containing protein [Candidatus Omnitrophota bacterium]